MRFLKRANWCAELMGLQSHTQVKPLHNDNKVVKGNLQSEGNLPNLEIQAFTSLQVLYIFLYPHLLGKTVCGKTIFLSYLKSWSSMVQSSQ